MKEMDENADPIAQLYQSRIEQTHMEMHSGEKTFDYTNLYSVIERKELLQRKLDLSQQRIKEMSQENEIYESMLKQ